MNQQATRAVAVEHIKQPWPMWAGILAALRRPFQPGNKP